MKRTHLAALIVATTLSLSASAADVGVSVSIGEPGFFGRIDIGGYPPPALVYSRPVVIRPMAVSGPPVYLRVPPGHIKHWSRHCASYGACAHPVYFLQDDWYVNVYAPRYRVRHGEYRHHDWDDRSSHRDDGQWHKHRRGHGHDRDRGHDHDRG